MFSPESSVQAQGELIPAGTLLSAILVVKEVKTSQASGAQYANVELRVIGGPYEKRVFFDMIMDPFDSKASEGGKKMGILALTRIAEAVGIFNVTVPDSYNRYSDPSVTIYDVIKDIHGKKVAVKVKVEKGTDGHADKNKVSEWLTPNPNSGTGYKGWTDLLAGGGNPPQRAGAFGGAPTSATPAAGGPASWLTKPNAAPAAAVADPAAETPPPGEDKPPY